MRALQKLIGAFGDSLIDAVNPVTGRLHTNFIIAGACTGRFSARWAQPAADAKASRGRFSQNICRARRDSW